MIEDVRFRQSCLSWVSFDWFLLDAVLKKKVVKECPGVENTLNCNPPCSYTLETVNSAQQCAISYSAGTDVKYFYQSSTRSSETGRICYTCTNRNLKKISININIEPGLFSVTWAETLKLLQLVFKFCLKLVSWSQIEKLLSTLNPSWLQIDEARLTWSFLKSGRSLSVMSIGLNLELHMKLLIWWPCIANYKEILSCLLYILRFSV